MLEEFTEKAFVFDSEGNITAHRSVEVPNLNWFVWVTMSNVTETLELPVDILKDTNRYYLDLTKEIDNYKRFKGIDKLFSARRLYKLVSSTEETLIKRMEEQITTYQGRLSEHKQLGAY